jgi:hypothetical protein
MQNAPKINVPLQIGISVTELKPKKLSICPITPQNMDNLFGKTQ